MHTLKRAILPVLLVATFFACGSEPDLDVQVAEGSDSAESSSAHLARIPGAEGEGELPEGHPPVGDLPEGHPPMGGAGGMTVPPPMPGTGTGESSLVWEAPEGWTSEPPTNAMRRAQYRVTGPGGDAQCVVFYFGPGQGGDPMANARRWAEQFAQPDGSSPADAMETETIQVDGIPVLLVEVSGTYQPSPMAGGSGTPQPGYKLLGSIAQGPDANWFFKLTGPEATVEAQEEAFLGMMRSLRQGTDPGQSA